MSVAIVHSRALVGVHAPCVAVEVHVAGGLPGIHVVGLPDTEVREARDRVRAALQNAQFEVPARKVVVVSDEPDAAWSAPLIDGLASCWSPLVVWSASVGPSHSVVSLGSFSGWSIFAT